MGLYLRSLLISTSNLYPPNKRHDPSGIRRGTRQALDSNHALLVISLSYKEFPLQTMSSKQVTLSVKVLFQV